MKKFLIFTSRVIILIITLGVLVCIPWFFEANWLFLCSWMPAIFIFTQLNEIIDEL
jgi:hypothetical protein